MKKTITWEQLKHAAEKIGATAVISVIVSTLVATYTSNLVSNHFEIQRDNTRERVQSLLYREQQLDDSHNAIFAALGIYTDKILNHDGSAQADKEELQRAIISTQAKLMNLRDQVGNDDAALKAYDTELSQLAISLRDVSRPQDLGPVFVAAQRVLNGHQKLALDIRDKTQITNF